MHRSAQGSSVRWYLGNPTQPAWTDRQPEPGVTYDYWVTACNHLGCSDYAGPASGWLGEPPPPRSWLPIFGLRPQ